MRARLANGVEVGLMTTVGATTATVGPQPADGSASAVASVAGFPPDTVVRLAQALGEDGKGMELFSGL